MLVGVELPCDLPPNYRYRFLVPSGAISSPDGEPMKLENSNEWEFTERCRAANDGGARRAETPRIRSNRSDLKLVNGIWRELAHGRPRLVEMPLWHIEKGGR